MGYMPRKSSQVQKLLESLLSLPKELKQTAIFFESPYRVIKTLEIMKTVLQEREIVIARELTKVYEEIRRGDAATLLTYFSKREPKGEFVILFHTE